MNVICERAEMCLIGNAEEPPVKDRNTRYVCQHRVVHPMSVHCGQGCDVCEYTGIKLRKCIHTEVKDET